MPRSLQEIMRHFLKKFLTFSSLRQARFVNFKVNIGITDTSVKGNVYVDFVFLYFFVHKLGASTDGRARLVMRSTRTAAQQHTTNA